MTIEKRERTKQILSFAILVVWTFTSIVPPTVMAHSPFHAVPDALPPKDPPPCDPVGPTGSKPPGDPNSPDCESLRKQLIKMILDALYGPSDPGEDPEEGEDGEADPDKPECADGTNGDPFYLHNGEFFLSKSYLYQSNASIPMAFTLRYSVKAGRHSNVGYGWTHNFNQRLFETDEGRIIWRNPQGNPVLFEPVVGEPGRFRAMERRPLFIEINGNGSYTLDLGNRGGYLYQFDVEGRLTSMENSRGAALVISYDAGGLLPVEGISRYSRRKEQTVVVRDWRLIKVEEKLNGGATGRYFDFSYDSSGHLASVSNQSARTVNLTYSADGRGDLSRVVSPGGFQNDYTYFSDAQDEDSFFYGYLKTFTGLGCADCVIRENQYDNQGRLIVQIEGSQGEGERIEVIYQSSANPYPYTEVRTRIKDVETGTVLNTRTERTYFTVDGFGSKRVQRKEVFHNQGWRLEREYTTRDAVTGQVTLVTLGNGGTIAYEYDVAGRITKKTRSIDVGIDQVSERQYNAQGLLILKKFYRTDLPGEEFVTEYEYHPNSELISNKKFKKADASYVTTQFNYNAAGQLEERIDPRGNAMHFDYTTAADAPAPEGLIERVYDPVNPGHETLIVYDAQGNAISFEDSNGNVTMTQYDVRDRPILVTNAVGTEVHYSYDESNLVEVKIGNLGEGYRIQRFNYNGLNQLTETYRVNEAEQEVSQSKNYWDSSDRVLMQENALGQVTSFDYDANNNLLKVTLPFAQGVNSITNYSYDDRQRLISVTDPEGAVSRFDYNLLNQIIEVTRAAGKPEERVDVGKYNALGQPIELSVYDAAKTNQLATTFLYYDRLGRLTGVNWNPVNNDKSGDRVLPSLRTYDGNGNLLTLTDGESNVTELLYDTYNRVETVRYADHADYNGGNDRTFTYDEVGNRLLAMGGRGIYRYTKYDALNRPVAISVETDQDWVALGWEADPLKVAASIEYNTWNQVKQSANADGGVSVRTYDRFGRMVTHTAPSGHVLNFSYSALDRPTQIDYPSVGGLPATSEIFNYRAENGYLIESGTDRSGNQSSVEFYRDFLLKKTIRSQNQVAGIGAVREYDDLDRLTKLTNALGNSVVYAYDNLSRVSNITYPDHVAVTNERIENFAYDQYDRVTERTGAGGYAMKYEYDLAGNLLTLTDGKGGGFGSGSVTTWAYDVRNRMNLKTYSDGKTESFTFDENGLIASHTDGKAKTVNFTYETARNLLATIDYPSDADVFYMYDKSRRRISMTDGSGLSEWSFDALGRLEIYKQHAVDRQMQYVYDSAHRTILTKVRRLAEVEGAPGEWVTQYSYDGAGRLGEVLDNRVSGVNPFQYQWQGDANLISSVTYPGGSKQVKKYDELGRLNEIDTLLPGGASQAKYSYQYNSASQREQMTLLSGEEVDYLYNASRELSSAISDTDGGYDFQFSFDEIGNRLQETEDGVVTSYLPTSVNQYSQINSGVIVVPTYDDNGNITSDGTREYEWDEANRLIEVRKLSSSQRVEYIYDGDGKLVGRSHYDALTGGNLLSEKSQLYAGWLSVMDLDGTDAELESRTWGLDISQNKVGTGGVGGLLARQPVGGNAQGAFYDGNGNLTTLLDLSTGTMSASYTYDPFGAIYTSAGPEAINNVYRFSTHRQDEVSGLVYYGYRHYDPEMGRWTNRDPIKELGGANVYGFVHNNGISEFDRLGLMEESVVVHGVDPTLSSAYPGFTELQLVQMQGSGAAGWSNVLPGIVQGVATLGQYASPAGWIDLLAGTGYYDSVVDGIQDYKDYQSNYYADLLGGDSSSSVFQSYDTFTEILVGFAIPLPLLPQGGNLLDDFAPLIDDFLPKKCKLPKGPGLGGADPGDLIPLEGPLFQGPKNIAKLVDDMSVNGWTGGPIDVFEHGGNRYILDGHHRVRAASEVGLEVPYRLVPESELGGFGYGGIDEVLEAIQTLGYPAPGTGLNIINADGDLIPHP